MKKSLLLAFSAWMITSSVHVAEAQRARPDRGAIRAGRQENKAAGAQGRTPRGGSGNNGGTAGGGQGATGAQGGTANTPNGNNVAGQDAGAQTDAAATAATKSRIDALRALMVAAGITETLIQDNVIGFVFEQERQRVQLLGLAREAVAQINQTAGTQANGLTAVATAQGEDNKDVMADDPGLSKYQEYANALEGDTARYNADLQRLDEAIGYSKKPRLEAFLSLAGILDNQTFAFGGPAAIFAPASEAPLPVAAQGDAAKPDATAKP